MGSFLLISVRIADRQFGACANVACAMPLAQLLQVATILAEISVCARSSFSHCSHLASACWALSQNGNGCAAVLNSQPFWPRACMKPAWAVRGSSHAPRWAQRSSVKRQRSASSNLAVGSAVQGERQCQPPPSPAWHRKNLAEMLAHVWPSVGSK